ncbi:MAG: DUF3137 domain-containing protein [Bacilli bacterium]|jgi:hypothetical protein
MLEGDFSNELKERTSIQQRLTPIVNDPDANSLVAKLRKKKKSLLIGGWIAPNVIGLIICIILAVQGSASICWLPFVVTIIISLIITLSSKKYGQDIYAQHFVPKVVKAIYGDDAIYQRKTGFARSYLEGLKAFPVNDLLQQDFISGSYDGVPCMGCDVLSTHEETTTDAKGNTTTRTVIDFQGCVYSLKMNKTTPHSITVTEGHKWFSGKGIQFESIAFNKMYRTYCSDEHTAFYIITPQLEEGMIDINRSIAGGITFLFRGDELVIIISGHTCNFDVNYMDSVNHNINVIVDAILPLAYVIEELHLSHEFTLDADKVLKEEQANKNDTEKSLQTQADIENKVTAAVKKKSAAIESGDVDETTLKASLKDDDTGIVDAIKNEVDSDK